MCCDRAAWILRGDDGEAALWTWSSVLLEGGGAPVLSPDAFGCKANSPESGGVSATMLLTCSRSGSIPARLFWVLNWGV